MGYWCTAESREQRVDEKDKAVEGGYALEMRLLGGDALHRGVVGVEVGVVADD